MVPATSSTQQIKLNFGDEIMEVIAATVESMDMSFDDYKDKLTPEKIQELHNRILPVFVSIHRKGLEDAKAIYRQGRVL